MPQYKTVAGPVGITISQNGSYSDAVRQYADIINREAVDGWKLDCIQEIPVTKDNGCLGFLFGQANTTVKFNMLVFVRETPEASKAAPAAPKSASVPAVTSSSPDAPNKGNAPVSAEVNGDEKVCPKCGTAQRLSRKICWSCGQHFDN